MSAEDLSVVFSDEQPPVDTLAVGVSKYGLAGLTAVDYLSDQHSMSEIGHLRTPGSPFMTPFENGTPRHHSRLYVDEAASYAVLVGERFVPPAQVGAFAEAITAAGGKLDVSNITILTGVPIAHGWTTTPRSTSQRRRTRRCISTTARSGRWGTDSSTD